MSSIQERLQLKRVPLDTWNIREQLCLASAVVRSGDQNWMSVSRALKTVGEPNRPPDWYSQKSCAAQYGALLEHVETPKRKKRCSEGAVETPQESIVKRLTQERIVEIQKTIAEMNQQYDQLKNEITEVRNPSTSEDRLREIWTSIEATKRARERENARRAAWLKEREERRARVDRNWRPAQSSAPTTPTSPGCTVVPPSSPLLTSLLKSSPVVTTPQHITHPANVIDSISPSVTAPTLSMLLEKNSAQQESKYAAIEHIKSQLVQIEQQLKANTPPATLPVAPAVDIDDIEIKAEDVYVFRDIDLHIPQVGNIHKNTRPTEKPTKKDEDEQIIVDNDTTTEPVKEEQITIEETPEDSQVDVETEQVEDVEMVLPEPEVTAPIDSDSVKLSFPEVKFPTTEIKVIQSDEQKVKEEIKEIEPEEQTEELHVEEIEIVEQTNIQETEQQPIEEVTQELLEQDNKQTDEQTEAPAIDNVEPASPQTIEPPEPQETEVQEPIPPPEPEVPPPPIPEPEPEVKIEPETAPEAANVDVTTADVKVEDEIKKDEDAEDSIPLKQMLRDDNVRVEIREDNNETDDDTPMELSREEEKDGKTKRDYSRKKKPDSRTCSGSESAAESAPASPSTDADRQHKLWKKSVMLVYTRLCAHKYASLFLRPISNDEAPGYSLVVKRPMDLTSIRKNIENGVIRTTAEFQRDVLLMLTNALMYNSSEHSVYSMAKEMHEEAGGQLGMLLAAQAHAGLCAAPPARKRRRPHTPTTHPYTRNVTM